MLRIQFDEIYLRSFLWFYFVVMELHGFEFTKILQLNLGKLNFALIAPIDKFEYMIESCHVAFSTKKNLNYFLVQAATFACCIFPWFLTVSWLHLGSFWFAASLAGLVNIFCIPLVLFR